MEVNQQDQLIVALDVDTFDEARHLIDELKDVVSVFKVGSQLFTACGPMVIRYLHAKGKKVFLDLKFHDIPNTVANALRSVVQLGAKVHTAVDDQEVPQGMTEGIFLCTVHIIGGEEMLTYAVAEAKSAAVKFNIPRPLIVGITVLTSQNQIDNIDQVVLERARLAKKCGLDGVVASSLEARMIREDLGEDFIIVTPGIRPQGADAGDQKRVTTPQEAITQGSNYLVVGRPIVKADDPLSAARKITEEIRRALI
ncbi:MAG: orotidine-5'-phosphate decarboxylase [Candidatus Omnitrophica bacterium]|nr:orotidine-5'-phosphate decarboxylase [Candidatus Omnitrophota bacterium]